MFFLKYVGRAPYGAFWAAVRGIIFATMTHITSFLQSVKLPVMPEVAQALIRTLSDDDADVTTIATIIAKDPALSAILLRMANSAMFGLSRRVDSLESAVSVIGMSHIRARALAICMANTFAFPAGMNRLEFWRNSMVCAGYSKWLAAHAGVDEQQAWLTGLMLRLGEIVIARCNPDALGQIEIAPCKPGERWKRERDLAGFDEGEISAEIARHWDFPESVALTLQAAAQPLTKESPKLSAVIHLGALLTDQSGQGQLSFDDLPVTVVRALALDATKLQSQVPNADAFSDISMLQG